MTEHDNQAIRPAATVIIARDASPQYEIFMLRRSNQAAFAGGMYVFPGGRVDQEDHSPIYDGHLQGPSVAQRAQQDALGEEWQSYWITGVGIPFTQKHLQPAQFTQADESRQRTLSRLHRVDRQSRCRTQGYRQNVPAGNQNHCQEPVLSVAETIQTGL